MRRFRVFVEEWQHGKLVKESSTCCDVRGKDLTEEEILRRLTNNIKTWQTACNKAYWKQDHFTFKVIGYKEV